MWHFNPTAYHQLIHVVTGKVKRIKSTESDTLYLLISNEGHYVTKKLIMHEVWGGRPVSENNITQSISQLRFLLGDSGKEQKIIKTKPREGYMLLPGNVILIQSITSTFDIEEKNGHTIINIEKNTNMLLLNESIESIKFFYRKYVNNKIKNLFFIIFLIIATVNFYNIYNLFYQKKDLVDLSIIIKKEYNTHFHLDRGSASEKLYLYLKDDIPDTISHIFIFNNPDRFYLSCIYYNKTYNQDKAYNISFTDDYPFELILGKIREACN